MSIPGLGQAAPVAAAAAPTLASSIAVHDLQANTEWRFEVAIGQSIEVRVLSGTAEIFGTELALNHTYTFRGTKAAIYTWHGTRLEVKGNCEEYIAEETPMVSYVNTHFALDKLREEAKAKGGEGPRVLVVGPNNSGKTSLVKLLTSYALRTGSQPMVINTDSREGILSIPGSLTATTFASIVDVEQGWGSSPTSTSTPVPVKLPLCYYYGLPQPDDNPKLYKPIVTRLALAASGRLADDKLVRGSGMLIDTAGSVSSGKNGYELISHIVSEFSVNVILVLGSERLHSDITRRFSTSKTTLGETITVVKLDKSGGCVDRDYKYMQQFQELSIKEYFFGDLKTTLSPHTQQLNFDDILIYKITDNTEPKASTFLPGGSEDVSSSDPSNPASSSQPQTIFILTPPGPSISHCILAVMHASSSDSEEAIRDASVMGFVYVADVDEKKRRLKILAPMTTRIADRALVWGSWPEANLSLMG